MKHEVKKKKLLQLIWNTFQSKEEWRFPFWIIFFRFRDTDIFVLCKWKSDDVINCFTKTLNTESRISLENVLKPGTRNVHHKRKKSNLLCRCHDNGLATEISSFCLNKGSFTPNNILKRVKTTGATCMFRKGPSVPL